MRRAANSEQAMQGETVPAPPIKRICVLAMIDGMNVMGELIMPDERPSAELRQPCILQLMNGQLGFHQILRNGLLSGDSVDVNMRAVKWISSPSPTLLGAYRAAVSGIVMPGATVAFNSASQFSQ
jgi:hypothetical protein